MRMRELSPADAAGLRAFFAAVPERDRTFFKEDVLDPAAIAGWTSDTRGRRLIGVEDDGSIAGYVAVLPGVSLSSHVGEIRLVVAPAARGRGVGRELARRILVDALRLGLSKVFVEVVAEQEPAIRMFAALGFTAEALLRDHLRDRDGKLHDLVVLSHFAAERWSEMLSAGLGDELE